MKYFLKKNIIWIIIGAVVFLVIRKKQKDAKAEAENPKGA